MRWVVCILAVVAALFSAGSLYYAYMAGFPAVHQVEGLSAPDAPHMQLQWVVDHGLGNKLPAVGMPLPHALGRVPS